MSNYKYLTKKTRSCSLACIKITTSNCLFLGIKRDKPQYCLQAFKITIIVDFQAFKLTLIVDFQAFKLTLSVDFQAFKISIIVDFQAFKISIIVDFQARQLQADRV